MELYLVRHAESKNKEEDLERGLSDLGFTNIRRVAAFVKNMNICVDTILHSDKLRARQTANELAKTINATNGLKQRDGIAPMDDINSMKEEINKSDKNLILVGHLPYLGKLTSALLCEDKSKNIVSFQNGVILKLVRTGETNSWSIEWMITPKICRA